MKTHSGSKYATPSVHRVSDMQPFLYREGGVSSAAAGSPCIKGLRPENSTARDETSSVIFTRSAYHREGCKFLVRASQPESAPRWQALYRMTPPCRICWRAQEMNWWLRYVRWFHTNCSPHSHLRQPVKVAFGRPRAFDLMTFKRILIHLRGGRSYREVAKAISESEGVSCTRQTVWRAVNAYSPYDQPDYRDIATELGF